MHFADFVFTQSSMNRAWNMSRGIDPLVSVLYEWWRNHTPGYGERNWWGYLEGTNGVLNPSSKKETPAHFLCYYFLLLSLGSHSPTADRLSVCTSQPIFVVLILSSCISFSRHHCNRSSSTCKKKSSGTTGSQSSSKLKDAHGRRKQIQLAELRELWEHCLRHRTWNAWVLAKCLLR